MQMSGGTCVGISLLLILLISWCRAWLRARTTDVRLPYRTEFSQISTCMVRKPGITLWGAGRYACICERKQKDSDVHIIPSGGRKPRSERYRNERSCGYTNVTSSSKVKSSQKAQIRLEVSGQRREVADLGSLE